VAAFRLHLPLVSDILTQILQVNAMNKKLLQKGAAIRDAVIGVNRGAERYSTCEQARKLEPGQPLSVLSWAY
jgi:hypothetical protein